MSIQQWVSVKKNRNVQFARSSCTAGRILAGDMEMLNLSNARVLAVPSI